MKQVFGEFIERTVEALERDPRFLGLAVAGSWVRDEIDEFSDLDLIIVCRDDAVTSPAAMRSVANELGSLISSFTGEHVGEPTLLICLFEADRLIHVDLKFVGRDGLEKRPYDPVVVWERESSISDVLLRSTAAPVEPDRQWIEDRFWTWVHYAALRIGRGELFDLMSFLSFVREQVLGPMALHAAGYPAHGVRKIERYLPDFARRLEATVPAYDRASGCRATVATIEIYRELRAAYPQRIIENERAERESMRFLEAVAARTIP